MTRWSLFPISLLLSSAACSSETDYAERAGLDGDARAVARTAPAAESMRFEDKDERDGGYREFSYAWPEAVGAQPALVRLLTAERDRLLAQEKSEYAAAIADAPADCVTCRNRSYAMEWKVVADTPGFLSLSGDFSTYTGGAHGMYGLRSLVWDKTKGRALEGAALFASPEALQTALGAKLCSALNAAREAKRGEPVPAPGPDDMGFNACSAVRDATVLVGSSNGRTFDRIGIWYGPYVAGSYAEGAYELDFPVDAAVLGAVKPEYRAAFAAKR